MELILIVLAFLIVLISDILLRITYTRYIHKENENGITGAETAKRILSENDLDNIRVGKIGGFLSDHYNNSRKEINLSSKIYEGTSIASVAVAAHECGHAIQYKEGYIPIKIRNMLVPLVNLGNTLGYVVILISLGASITKLFILGLILVSFALLFQLITLPVEFNASKRGKKILLNMGIIEENEKFGVAVMLFAAAFTYVAGLLSSLLQILRLVLLFINSERD